MTVEIFPNSVTWNPRVKVTQIKFDPFERWHIQTEALSPHSFDFVRLCNIIHGRVGVTHSCIDVMSENFPVAYQ